MQKKWDLLKTELGESRVKMDESLHYHTGSHLDLPAEAFYIATNQRELQRVLDVAYELGITFKILGYDTIETKKKAKHVDGLVIRQASAGCTVIGQRDLRAALKVRAWDPDC